MKMRIVWLVFLALAVSSLFLASSSAPEAAAPCIQCPLAPLPDECPPCTEWVPQTCRKCATCKPIPGCHA
jgi:hypothetical protein